MFKLSHSVFILILIVILRMNNVTSDCIYDTTESSLKCEEFESPLNNIQVPPNLPGQKITTLFFRPSKNYLILNNEMIGLDNLKDYIDKDDYTIRLSNFNRVNFGENPFRELNHGAFRKLILDDMRLRFEINGQDIAKNCNLDRNDIEPYHLFFTFNHVEFKNINYNLIPDGICPIIFINTRIKNLVIEQLQNDNMIKFVSLQQSSSSKKLSSLIEKLEVKKADLNLLDAQILNKNLFENVLSISYTEVTELEKSQNDSFLSIDPQVFNHLNKLKDLELGLNNIDLFLKNSSQEWLNNGLNVNGTNIFKLVLRDLRQDYEFLEEDFCSFIDFPHKRKIYPMIHTKKNLECSCTLNWLLKNANEYTNKNEIITESVANCFDQNKNLIDLKCDFDRKIKLCKDLKTITTENPSSTTQITKTTVTLEIVTNKTVEEQKTDYTATIVSCVLGVLGIISMFVMIILYFKFKSVNKKHNTFKDEQVNNIKMTRLKVIKV
jgi:hypothetical protein